MTEEQAALRYAAMGYTLKDHPDRREVVQLEAADGYELIWALRDIIRPSHGKPYLGKMSAIERPEGIAGRFLDLLPRKGYAETGQREPPSLPRIRSSSELADDVGRVFVTAVLDAPFQLTGRRDPANSELCVGGIVGVPKDAPWPPPDQPSWIEVVTGPEAERLILSVHFRLTEQAEQEKITLEQLIEKLSQSSPIKMIFNCVCPTCGKAEGPFYIRRSLWFYCREHKVKWIAGYDLSVADEPPDDECKRRFDEIGLGEFKYLGPDADEYERQLTGPKS
jgi:hypothetical protein